MKTLSAICILLSLIGISCKDVDNSNRVYFTIMPENQQIIIPVQLNDSITANLTFDTGFYDGAFILDSTFLASHPGFTPGILPDSSKIGSGWATNRALNLKYDTLQMVKIGNTELAYQSVNIANWKSAMYDNHTEGLFNIPVNDTTHIWELNFEHNYLEIHPAAGFEMPKNVFLFPMEKEEREDLGISNSFYVQFPMQIKSANNDTLTIHRTYMIDTGMAWDIVLKETEDMDFLNQRNDAVWTKYIDGYYRHYTTEATLFNQLAIDSLRLHRFECRPVGFNLVGQNFLKRFNVFFDRKNRQLGLQPINNYERIVNPHYRRYHYLAPKTEEGKYIVTHIADYESNYIRNAGLQLGDEIIKINNKPAQEITRDEQRVYYLLDTLYYDIVRKGEAMQLVIPVDKNEEQGD